MLDQDSVIARRLVKFAEDMTKLSRKDLFGYETKVNFFDMVNQYMMMAAITETAVNLTEDQRQCLLGKVNTFDCSGQDAAFILHDPSNILLNEVNGGLLWKL